MTQAYSCDICGDCIANEQDAKSTRQLVRRNFTVNAIEVDTGIIIKAYVPHVCDTCFALLRTEVKNWILSD